jgi:hypothetical protein
LQKIIDLVSQKGTDEAVRRYGPETVRKAQQYITQEQQ